MPEMVPYAAAPPPTAQATGRRLPPSQPAATAMSRKRRGSASIETRPVTRARHDHDVLTLEEYEAICDEMRHGCDVCRSKDVPDGGFFVAGGFLCTSCHELTEGENPMTRRPYHDENPPPGQVTREALDHLEMQRASRMDKWFKCPCGKYSSIVGVHKYAETERHVMKCDAYLDDPARCKKTLSALWSQFTLQQATMRALEAEMEGIKREEKVVRHELCSYRLKYDRVRDALQSVTSLLHRAASTADTTLGELTPPRPVPRRRRDGEARVRPLVLEETEA